MDQVNLGEGYGGLSVQPAKRRRGRPRKQSSTKPDDSVQSPPGFERVKEQIPRGADSLVGQAVTGIIESTFDAGYLLTVKIGNSNISLRGVVFKPGQYMPVTAGNDVAPHIQMIQRNDVNHSRPQNLTVQSAGGAVASKRKYGPSKTDSSIPVVGARGTVVLEPADVQNGSLPTPKVSQTTRMFDFGDKDVHMVEPISMLPPNHTIPAGQIFANHPIHQISQADNQSINGSFNEGTYETGQMNKSNDMMAKEINSSDSSQSSGSKSEDSKEASPEDSGVLSNHETGNTGGQFSIDFSQGASITKPLFSYGSGRMTDLLQAVQENVKDNKGQVAEQPPVFASDFGFFGATPAGTHPTNEANAP